MWQMRLEHQRFRSCVWSSVPMWITSELYEVVTTIILQMLIGIIVISVISYATPCLLYRVVLMWRWHQVKKVGANLQKCMDDFFTNLPPRESEYCKNCKHSEVSSNNGNLICLHEKSRHFGEAISPEQDKSGFCYFERVEQINAEEDSNAIHHHQTTAKILSNDI